MNIENLVSEMKISLRKAVIAAGCGDRLPASKDVQLPVIWMHRDGSRDIALTELFSYDYSASAAGITQYIGFKTDSGEFVQFAVENGRAYHDMFTPVEL